MYKNIRPGKTLYDTQGKRVQAHGGSILYADGLFYLYGENKDGITGTATGEKCPFWHHGVRLYSSSDLYNWQDEGVIMYEPNDDSSPFYPKNIMDRPHILFNEKTGLYVMWAKCVKGDDFGFGFFAVAVSERIHGPFRLYAEITCDPFHAGDFDLVKDGDSAYIIYENPHTEMICQTLNDEYTGFTEEFSTHLPEKCPPFTREAPAFFKRGERKFLLTSGTTGYYPNATQLEEIHDFHGEWETLGNPCRNDRANNSFHAQFSSVFKHPFIDDLYIALGDRWLKDLPVDLPDMNEIFHRLCNKDMPPLLEDFRFSEYSDENTSEADYVWLPVLFDENGTPYIEWRTEWDVESFKKAKSK